MSLFDNGQNDRFFHPLSCRNKKIYYECILQLLEKSKAVPLLYETDARDCLILYLRNCMYAVVEEDDNISQDEILSNNKSEMENAAAILKYFRSCGWISEREIGRNGDNIATITPFCRKLMDAIARIFDRDTSGALTNHIFAIYDTLKSALEADNGRTIRPYSNILVPLTDNVADLKNELLMLKDSIRSIMRVVIQMTEVNNFGQFLIKNEMMDMFFNDYFFIKKDGLIPGYMAEIERMLRRIKDAEIYENMIREHSSLKQSSAVHSREIIDGQFGEIQSFIFYDYAREMDYIDKKINNYYNLYATRMLMVLSNHTNLQTYINDLLRGISKMDGDNRSETLLRIGTLFQLASIKYIGRRSIERRKKRNPNSKSGAITKSTLSKEERERLTRELLREEPDKYSMELASYYYDRLLQGKSELTISEENIKSREDAMMAAAGIIYSGAEGFAYAVEFLGGMVETKHAAVSRFQIKRRT
jgi:hypothetical protein